MGFIVLISLLSVMIMIIVGNAWVNKKELEKDEKYYDMINKMNEDSWRF